MAEKPDYYTLLGVPRDADAAALKKAFRARAMEVHPDRNSAPDAEAQFKQVNEAYAVLSDPEKRARYDQYGHEGPGRVDPFSGGGINPDDLRDMFGGDLFEQFFGGFFRNATRAGARHGRDITVDVRLSLEDVAKGGEKTVEYRRPGPCALCSGSGARAGTMPQACRTCGGAGRVRVQAGFIAMVQGCPECAGQGKVVVDPCGACRGSGLTEEVVTIKAPLPPGLETGHKLRLDGEGAHGRQGGLPGDLYLRVEVAEHPFFNRKEADLICEVPISIAQAALGASVEVPTLEGKAQVKIPAGTQSGKTMRLKGRGLPRVGGRGQGDQLVRLQVETPVKLTARQKELLEEFERIARAAHATEHGDEGDHGEPRRKSFLDKLKAMFD